MILHDFQGVVFRELSQADASLVYDARRRTVILINPTDRTMSKDAIWAPWRMGYIHTLVSEERQEGFGRERGCFLCEAASPDLTPEAGRDMLLLARNELSLLMLNRYPYANGHLLVAARVHAPDISDLSAEHRASMMEHVNLGCRLLRLAMNCHGINVGMNLGRVAGAGVPGHAHIHLVPRWHGDINFMEVVGDVRVIPQALEDSYASLLDALEMVYEEDREEEQQA